MIPSKIIKRQEQLNSNSIQDVSQMKKVQSNLMLVSKASSLPKQFEKNEKLKTTGNKMESFKHSKNNSMNHLSTTENTKIIDSIQNVSSIYITNKTEEIQLRNEIHLKALIIADLNKNIAQLQQQNATYQVTISQLEKDVQQLNQTIEKMCEQLTDSSNEFNKENKMLQDQITSKDKIIKFFKAENQQLLTIIKQGSYNKTKIDKENQPIVTQANQQDQINYLKDQIDLQRKQFQQTEDSLQKQITGLNLFVNELFQQQSSDRLNTNISSRNEKDTRNRKLSLQYDMDSFQSQLQHLDKQKHKLDHKFDNIQCNLNQLTEKQLNSVCTDNTQNTKEIIKLKQIVQIQKKQIELQQKTILNQHFEIQNLQTLLYKNDQDSVSKRKEIKEIQDDIITNEFTNSPKDEIYHLNDSQSEIKPKYYLDSIQNTFQKFQVITEESTFRS
ncbi:unnamed protein product (macronuclear) [Paramecium tetraurelia]|uniref:Uncharacterized protein n=1 Tax=Paramecium tetraurelia TaxID=5888 RepID=A0C3R2_PARTE|nr:uncharacterized protein GSPATT00034908001 [Paramecium tetraurelia]CAK65429.1 unnamed protein product [Paramecium tetraurelia]|eukprot:XP_001432826.1 hypothetical protein (macronuclear) [Paramecium tetraurelia strain d4-2]